MNHMSAHFQAMVSPFTGECLANGRARAASRKERIALGSWIQFHKRRQAEVSYQTARLRVENNLSGCAMTAGPGAIGATLVRRTSDQPGAA